MLAQGNFYMYNRNSLALPLGLTAALLFACGGCGVSSGQMSPLLPVKGKVTYKGQPVTQGHGPLRARRLRPAGHRSASI